MKRPEVDIIVPVHGQAAVTGEFLNHITANTEGVDYRLTVVDDASPDSGATKKLLHWWWMNTRRWVPWAKKRGVNFRVITRKTNGGFSVANNDAARGSKAHWLMFINNDAFPEKANWLRSLIARAEVEPFHAIGPISNSVLGIQHIKWNRHWGGELGGSFLRGRECDADPVHGAKFLSGFCVLVRRDAFEDVGGWDESFFMGDEDLALSIELRRAGYKLGVKRSVFVGHRNQSTMKQFAAQRGLNPTEWYARTRQQLIQYYGPQVQQDLWMWEHFRHPKEAWRALGVLDDGTYFQYPGKAKDQEEARERLRRKTYRHCEGDRGGGVRLREPHSGLTPGPAREDYQSVGEQYRAYRYRTLEGTSRLSGTDASRKGSCREGCGNREEKERACGEGDIRLVECGFSDPAIELLA